MSLVALASTLVFNPSTPHTTYMNESANEIYVTDYSTGKFRRYSMTTFAQVGSSSTNSNTYGVSLINSASAVTLSTITSQVQFIELSSGYVQGVSATTTTNGYYRNIASDLTNNQCLYFGSSTQNLYRINSNFTVTTLNIRSLSSVGNFSCIVNKGPGRWLVGTNAGEIYDIDSNGNILDSFHVSTQSLRGMAFTEETSTVILFAISDIVLDNNVCIISGTDGVTLVYDWTTKTLLYQYQFKLNNQTSGVSICNTGSGEVIIANGVVNSSNPGYCLAEVDLTCRPFSFYDETYVNSSNYLYQGSVQINTTTSTGAWVGTDASSNPRVYFYRVDGVRPTTTRTFTVQKDGVDQKARLILLEESGGSMVGRPLLDTYMQSPATYRVPTGKTIYEIVKIGEGEDATWDVSSYST